MIRQILGQTGIEVSALGFGCVQLTSHQTKKEAVTVLEHAFSSGITHFDVARMYGFGRAESILAEFVRGKRNNLTIASKFGFELPSSRLAGNPRLISLAKKILAPFPRLLHRAKTHGVSMVKGGAFSPQAAIKSLETSLKELQTDYLDILLLHEATMTDLTNEPLIESLQQQMTKGTIRCIGIASDFSKLNKDILLPFPYKVMQFNTNVVENNLEKLFQREKHALITHSIFKPLQILLQAIKEHPHIAQKFSSSINIDLCDPDMISVLLIHHALQQNRNGVTLFSSMSTKHISQNVYVSESYRFDEAQLAGFMKFVNELLRINALPKLLI